MIPIMVDLTATETVIVTVSARPPLMGPGARRRTGEGNPGQDRETAREGRRADRGAAAQGADGIAAEENVVAPTRI